nr:hypothetical protein [Tanacetum cinerariifolium]
MIASLLQINIASTLGSGSLPRNVVGNPKGELKAITTRSGLVIDGPTVPTPPQSINLELDERVEETFTDPDLAEYTIKVPPPPVQKYKPPKKKMKSKSNFWQMFKQLHINITLADALILMPKYQKMLKALLSNKEKLQELANTPLNENCSAVILKKLPKKLGDPEKFLISCGFSELKCKALADLGASINLMPLSVWKKLGRPFLWTARALIDVHGEEMILCDGDERLTLNMRHDTSSYSNQPQKELIYLINDSIDQKNLANLADIFVDSIPEMFTDEHTLDYSSPPIFDEYDDDFLEVESDAGNVYDDPFNSKEEKIK